jgi:formylmethanofuran dehydrogenase subunit C
MKFLSFKHNGSENKILTLGDTRARIGHKMRSSRLLLMGRAPKFLPTHRIRHWATLTYHSSHKTLSSLHTMNNTSNPEQLKLSKTDTST